MAVENNSSVHVAKLGKEPCAVCGKITTIVGRHELGDYSLVCRECMKKAAPYFNGKESSLEDLKAHNTQLENGAKLYEKYFNKNKKAKKFFKARFVREVVVDPVTALICVRQRRGGFLMFGGTWYNTVFRIADFEGSTHKVLIKPEDGKQAGARYAALKFHNVEGLSSVKFWNVSGGENTAFIKFINKSMGLTGLKGLKNTFDAAKAKGAAIGDLVNTAKEAAANKDDEAAVAQAQELARAQMDEVFYAGREELIEKADAAIKAVLG